MNYNKMTNMGIVDITVIKANLSFDACISSTMSTYFLSYLNGDNNSKYTSYASPPHKNSGKSPIWNQTFSLDLNMGKEIYIDIMNEKELISRCKIPVDEIFNKKDFQAEYGLYNGLQPRGQIFVKLKLIEKEMKIDNNSEDLSISSNYNLEDCLLKSKGLNSENKIDESQIKIEFITEIGSENIDNISDDILYKMKSHTNTILEVNNNPNNSFNMITENNTNPSNNLLPTLEFSTLTIENSSQSIGENSNLDSDSTVQKSINKENKSVCEKNSIDNLTVNNNLNTIKNSNTEQNQDKNKVSNQLININEIIKNNISSCSESTKEKPNKILHLNLPRLKIQNEKNEMNENTNKEPQINQIDLSNIYNFDRNSAPIAVTQKPFIDSNHISSPNDKNLEISNDNNEVLVNSNKKIQTINNLQQTKQFEVKSISNGNNKIENTKAVDKYPEMYENIVSYNSYNLNTNNSNYQLPNQHTFNYNSFNTGYSNTNHENQFSNNNFTNNSYTNSNTYYSSNYNPYNGNQFYNNSLMNYEGNEGYQLNHYNQVNQCYQENHGIYNSHGQGNKYNNNNNNTQSIYKKTLDFFKNPLLFQHNSNSIWYFDLINKVWKPVNNNSSQFFPIYHRATEIPDGSFLLTGGEYNNQSINYASHYVQGTFINCNNMFESRKAHGAVYVNGFVYVFGGFGNEGILNSSERFDLGKGQWQQLAFMMLPRAYANPVPYNDSYIFLVGGFSGIDLDGFLESNKIERYDIFNNVFEEFNIKLPNPVYGCISTFISDSHLLVAGGWSEEKQNSSQVFTINLSNGNINYLQDLPEAGWSILPVFYFYGELNFFFQGEETDALPTHHSYYVKTPFN